MAGDDNQGLLESEGEQKIDTFFLESVIQEMESFRNPHFSSGCSIHQVPPVISDLNRAAYDPKVVSIGPLHYDHSYSRSYKYTRESKWRILDSLLIFKHTDLEESQRVRILMNKCLTAMKDSDAAIRSCYSYEIKMDPDKLALVMTLDGCFILNLLLETRETQYYGRARIESFQLKHDLLLVENQIPFFILKELGAILGTGIGVSLVDKALDLFQDMDLPRNKAIPIASEGIHHLLHLFHMSRLPSSCPRPSGAPVRPIPCATELTKYGIMFGKNMKAESFLDVKFSTAQGFLRRGAMAIPPLNLRDSTGNLLLNLIAFEQCHPDSGFNITSYVAFLCCIINASEDAELLQNKGILVNGMTGANHDLTKFLECLIRGASIADGRFYLAEVFENVAKHQERIWQRPRDEWDKFKRKYCSNRWAVCAFVASIIFFCLEVLQTFFGIFQYYKPRR